MTVSFPDPAPVKERVWELSSIFCVSNLESCAPVLRILTKVSRPSFCVWAGQSG